MITGADQFTDALQIARRTGAQTSEYERAQALALTGLLAVIGLAFSTDGAPNEREVLDKAAAEWRAALGIEEAGDDREDEATTT